MTTIADNYCASVNVGSWCKTDKKPPYFCSGPPTDKYCCNTDSDCGITGMCVNGACEGEVVPPDGGVKPDGKPVIETIDIAGDLPADQVGFPAAPLDVLDKMNRYDPEHPIEYLTRKPWKKGRNYRMTLWHEGVVDVPDDSLADYFHEMVQFVKDKKFDRCFFNLPDPGETIGSSDVKKFAYAQPEFVAKNYVDKLPKECMVGVLLYVNPLYPWKWKADVPIKGGIMYNNPGYVYGDGNCQQNYYHCSSDAECFDRTVPNVPACGAPNPGPGPGPGPAPAPPVVCKVDSDCGTHHKCETGRYGPECIDLHRECPYIDSYCRRNEDGSCEGYCQGHPEHKCNCEEKLSSREPYGLPYGSMSTPTYQAEGENKLCSQIKYQCTAGKNCCRKYKLGCPNNMERAMMLIHHINSLCKVNKITSVCFDGEDIGEYGSDAWGTAQAWQAAEKYAPEIVDIGFAKGPGTNTCDTRTTSAYPEMYWIGELKPAPNAKQSDVPPAVQKKLNCPSSSIATAKKAGIQNDGVCCEMCKNIKDIGPECEGPDCKLCENCKYAIYTRYCNDPAGMLKVFKKYMDPYKTLVQRIGTCPLFSLENAHQGYGTGAPGQVKFGGTSCIQREYNDKGFCGTFDGFASWSWENFEKFMDLYAKDVWGDKIGDIGVYEWQFVPPQWRSTALGPFTGEHLSAVEKNQNRAVKRSNSKPSAHVRHIIRYGAGDGEQGYWPWIWVVAFLLMCAVIALVVLKRRK